MTQKTPSKFALWLLAIRPKTLPAAVGPVAVGSAVALSDDLFSLLPALGCLLGAMLLQVAVNLANDYFDFKNEIDSDERLGPTRVTQSGLIAPSQVKKGMSLCLGLAGLIFVYLSYVGGWPIVIVGSLSLLAALAYSGGPYPLASNGLGELFVFIFFGLVAVCGTYYIQAGQLSQLVVIASIPPGLLITAIMVINNLRDIDTDEKAGKKTLAVMLGRRNTILEFQFLVIVSYLIPILVFFWYDAKLVLLFPLISLPSALILIRRVSIESGRQLNELLARSAKLSLLFSLLFSVGLAYGI